MTYEQIVDKERIEDSGSKGDLKAADEWRFLSLKKLIRYKEEGVYPNLVQRDDLIEKEILSFIAILRTSNVLFFA